MKTSVVLEAEALPKRYRKQIIALAFKAPDNPRRPLAHIYEWLDAVRWNPDFSFKDVETTHRIIQILQGERLTPKPRRGLLARLFGL